MKSAWVAIGLLLLLPILSGQEAKKIMGNGVMSKDVSTVLMKLISMLGFTKVALWGRNGQAPDCVRASTKDMLNRTLYSELTISIFDDISKVRYSRGTTFIMCLEQFNIGLLNKMFPNSRPAKYLFQYKWLLLSNLTNYADFKAQVRMMVEEVYIPLNADVYASYYADDGGLEAAELFQIQQKFKLKVNTAIKCPYNGDCQWIRPRQKFKRRGNFEGAELRVAAFKNSYPHKISLVTKRDEIRIDSGFFGDVWNAIREYLNFTYTVVLLNDSRSGNCNITTGECTGLMDLLVRQQIDVAVAPVTATHSRAQLVDFGFPLVHIKKRMFIRLEESRSNANLFIKSFHWSLWSITIVTWLCVSFVLWLIDKLARKYLDPLIKQYDNSLNPFPAFQETHFNPLTPVEKAKISSVSAIDILNRAKANFKKPLEKVEEDKSKMNAVRSLWLCFGSVCQQGTDTDPKSFPSKLVMFTSFLTFLILFTGYSSLLISFLAVRKTTTPFEDLPGLYNSPGWSLGITKGGATEDFFRSGEEYTLRKGWELISSDFRDNLVTSQISGLHKVLGGHYAYFSTTEDIYYLLSTQFPIDDACKVYATKRAYMKSSRTFGFQKYSPYIRFFNNVITILDESGVLGRLEQKYLDNNLVCDTNNGYVEATIFDVLTAFMLLGGGASFAIGVCIVECLLGAIFKQCYGSSLGPFSKVHDE